MYNYNVPKDYTAECKVIGCMLYDQYGLNTAVNMLNTNDFYFKDNANIFDCILELHRQSKPVDVVTVNDMLVQKGFSALSTKLAELVTEVSTTATTKQYCEIVQDKAFRRNSIANAQEVINKALEGNTDNLIECIEKGKSDYTKTEVTEALPQVLEGALKKVIENKKRGKMLAGVATGYTDFDDMIGGLEDESLIIIAGRPAMGKTAFALNLFTNVAKRQPDKINVFFSLEMSKEQLALRVYSSEMRIPNERFKFGTLTADDIQKMQTLNDKFEKQTGNIYIKDDMQVTARDMFSTCNFLKNKTQKEIGLVVVDYLQIMKTKSEENRATELGSISRELKRLSKEFKCPVIALSQLSRACDSRADHRPIMSDLRESGQIEQDADIICFLYRDEYYNKNSEMKNKAEVIIAKQRNGGIGTIVLGFMPKISTFYNLGR